MAISGKGMEHSTIQITAGKAVKIVDPHEISRISCRNSEEEENLPQSILLDPAAITYDTPVMDLVQSFAAGSLSASFSSVLLQPLDLVKTRVQLGRGSKQGLFRHLTHIAETETVLGLWRGTAATIVRSVPGVGLYFTTLHSLKMVSGIKKPTAGEALTLGCLSRSIAGAALLPATVIKTRFESGIFKYESMSHAAKSIYSKEGLRAFYSGLLPTLARDAPYSGLYLLFYTQFKNMVYESGNPGNQSDLTNFGCALIAGLCASAVTQPADVLKTKMQSCPESFPTVRCVVIYIAKNDGMTGFFSGLQPRLVRRTLMSAFAWTFYEKLTRRMTTK